MNVTTVVHGQQLFAIDEDYDHNRASDGLSRFGVYLSQRLPAVANEDPDVLTDPIRWAALAWATATPPVMSPGYLTWHDPIEDIQLGWDDGRLGAEIVIRTELPARLAGWRSWERDGYGDLVEPWHADRVALSRILLRTILDVTLPRAPGKRGTQKELVEAAKGTIAVVATAIEGTLAPVLLALGEPCSGRLNTGRQP
jgi:hypothetical protein